MNQTDLSILHPSGTKLSDVLRALADELHDQEEAQRRAGIVDQHYPTFRDAIVAANPHLRTAADALARYRGEMHPTLNLLAPGNANADVTLVLPVENVKIDERDGSVMIPVSTLVELLERMHRYNQDNVEFGPGRQRAEEHARRDNLFRAYGGNPGAPFRRGRHTPLGG
jgi:hypothetical protein